MPGTGSHSKQGAEPGPEPSQLGSWSHSLSQRRYAVASVQESLAGQTPFNACLEAPFFCFCSLLPWPSPCFFLPGFQLYSAIQGPWVPSSSHCSAALPCNLRVQSGTPANQHCPLAAVDPCHALAGWGARLKVPSPQDWEWGWMKRVRVTENPILTASPFFKWEKKILL